MNIDGAEAWGPVYKEGSSVGNVSFELGYHAENSTETKRKIDSGDLNAHTWEVGKRISSGVVAIDSLFPLPSEDLDTIKSFEDYPLEMKKEVLAWNPVRGREVLVVCGDMNFRTPAVDFTRFISDIQKKESLKKQGNDKNELEKDVFVQKIVAEHAAIAAAGFLTGAILHEIGRRDVRDVKQEKYKGMSRRDFLKTSGKVVGATTALYVGGRAMAGLLTPFASNESVSAIGKKFLALTSQPSFFEQHWLDGRTALLIEKANAALNQGITQPDTHASVVMGNAHGFESHKFLGSEKARKLAIHALAEDMVNFYETVLTDYPEIDKNDAMHRMLDLMCQADMVSVGALPESNTDPKRVNNLIDESVKYLFSFSAPGVRSSLGDLYKRYESQEVLEDLVKKVPEEEIKAEQENQQEKVIIPKIQ